MPGIRRISEHHVRHWGILRFKLLLAPMHFEAQSYLEQKTPVVSNSWYPWNFRTSRLAFQDFGVSSNYWYTHYPCILRPRALFFRAEGTCSFKFLTQALICVKKTLKYNLLKVFKHLESILSRFWIVCKGQIISKCFFLAEDSSKKWKNEFVFTTMLRVFIRFLEEIENSKKAFRNYLTFRLDNPETS